MSYVIVKSDGATLCTIQDGTINTTSTSLGLPGRLYPGYGQVFDTNYVYLLENFANNTPPANPIRGQLWYDIGNTVLRVCPIDGAANANVWVNLVTSDGNGNIYANNAVLTGNIYANNAFLSGFAEVSNGLYSSGKYTGPYTDGIVVDYVSGTGRISVGSADGIYFYNGGVGVSQIFSITSNGNITSGNATLGNLASANYIAGTLTTPAQPNITSVGTLTSLAVTGNISGANIAGAHFGDGGHLSNITAANITGTIANANYASYATQATNVTVTDDSSINNNYFPVFVSGATSNTPLGLDTAFTYNASSNTLTTGNLVVPGTISGTATAAGTSVFAGTVTTNAQPNITSVGTLTSLTVSGSVVAASITSSLYGNGIGITAINSANIIGPVAYATVANSVAGANVSGAVATANVANSVAGSNVSGPVAYATVANSVAGSNVSGPVAYATVANSVSGANVIGAVAVATVASSANTVAGANVTGSVSQSTYANTANSVAGANVTGSVSQSTYANTANSVAGANVIGAVAVATVASSANTVAGANVTGTVANATYAINTATVTTNAQPNITSVGTLISLAVTGNISGANITGVHYGNGSALSSLTAANVVGTVANATYALSAGTVPTVTTNAQPNITSVGTLSSLTVSGLIQGNGNTTFSSGTQQIRDVVEQVFVTASAPPSTTTVNLIGQSISYYTANATANWGINFQGNGTVSTNSYLTNGQSVTTTLLVTQGATAYYPTTFSIDGSSVTPKWLGGSAPTSGDTSSVDVYTFTIVKTASATYTVFASVSRYA